jgi:hypothetical protein
MPYLSVDRRPAGCRTGINFSNWQPIQLEAREENQGTLSMHNPRVNVYVLESLDNRMKMRLGSHGTSPMTPTTELQRLEAACAHCC